MRFCFALFYYFAIHIFELYHMYLPFVEKLGENVEPSEIEEAAMGSSLIQQIVVVGQVNCYLLRN